MSRHSARDIMRESPIDVFSRRLRHQCPNLAHHVVEHRRRVRHARRLGQHRGVHPHTFHFLERLIRVGAEQFSEQPLPLLFGVRHVVSFACALSVTTVTNGTRNWGCRSLWAMMVT